jgi:FkbM family methyltransferase
MRTSDVSVYSEIVHGQYEFDLPFEPRIILDAGANIGLASIYFARKYPRAKIFAIEPEASNFDVLRRNIQSYPSITAIRAALWNRDGEIAVSAPRSGQAENWAFVTGEDIEGERVRAVTLGTLMKELKLPAIDLAKIDIEGAEQEVFEDIGWVEGVGCVMIELHDDVRPGCSEIVETALQAFEHVRKGETTFFLRRGRDGATPPETASP